MSRTLASLVYCYFSSTRELLKNFFCSVTQTSLVRITSILAHISEESIWGASHFCDTQRLMKDDLIVSERTETTAEPLKYGQCGVPWAGI